MPGALALVRRTEPRAASWFHSDGELVGALAVGLTAFPAAALLRLARYDFRIVLERQSLYRPSRRLATVAVRHFLANSGVLEEEVTHALDHLLGSGGRGGCWSDGHGLTADLAALGREIRTSYQEVLTRGALRYYDAYPLQSPHEYLAHAARMYLHSEELRELLRAYDPWAYSLLESTLLNGQFWQGVPSPPVNDA